MFMELFFKNLQRTFSEIPEHTKVFERKIQGHFQNFMGHVQTALMDNRVYKLDKCVRYRT